MELFECCGEMLDSCRDFLARLRHFSVGQGESREFGDGRQSRQAALPAHQAKPAWI